ncbi:tRNA (adenosine(37)-N6)-threonylcarbamoyltransferase complex dimerization subunit type 1 TsaB [Lederbergia sp. NSJ-179]|uniref:tRNA (adenosine(37)-N6)-threonylcarbamoyltransferase complex dimerization subunit type 1 TsaB n=1 Tax=Lederbergia sp. NSJ-179 TaxID=2931402 RepID=UPI001FD5872C|nr:tRNA (adenosine(37)-N6)-threonylcarbamoyltransferase complex dimerization subunit type 1 TsaB [Lederbergia sp. NSJ-179]MCJ7841384.1 tRNA (adenosine(37)-N6)-threonylcarbamoyltransferase complex dimerization subunit type 1 TsaB [Lederbergia sp. NSJ-179]
MRILAIDTSNEVLGVALLNEDTVIGEYITNMKKNHSVRVMPAIEKLLADCETQATDLDKLIVAQGPGSYTGVRIGVTIAKTMAWALNIPLVGVSSLAVLAASGRYFDGYLSPLFDARRGLIYTGLYQYQDGGLVTVIKDQNILSQEWAEQLQTIKKPILFIGNDTPIHQDILTKTLHDQTHFAGMTEKNPRPGELGKLGLSLDEVHVHSFAPNYARLVEAEAKWLEKQERRN